MTITPKFKRGDIVTDIKGRTWAVDQINIRVWHYRGQQVVNITYRSEDPERDPLFPDWRKYGAWRHQGELLAQFEDPVAP